MMLPIGILRRPIHRVPALGNKKESDVDNNKDIDWLGRVSDAGVAIEMLGGQPHTDRYI